MTICLLMQVHTKEYVEHFNSGTLDAAAVRRIGFGEVTRQPILIERTKSEVAGRSHLAPACPDSCHTQLRLCHHHLPERAPLQLHILAATAQPWTAAPRVTATPCHAASMCRACASCSLCVVSLRHGCPRAGTLLGARLALKYGLAVNTAGGTHHAFPDCGSGFCLLNDIAVAARQLLVEQAVRRILVLDLDVHQVCVGKDPYRLQSGGS